MTDAVEEEIITLLRKQYLLHHIPLQYSKISDESLIYIYIHLLCTYDFVNELLCPNCEENYTYDCSAANLRHIVKCLRPLGLSYLAKKNKDLLDKKNATKILFALHDRNSSKYGKTLGQRIRLVIKRKEVLSKTQRSRNDFSKLNGNSVEKNFKSDKDEWSGESKMMVQDAWLCSASESDSMPAPLPPLKEAFIPGGWQIPRTPLKVVDRNRLECDPNSHPPSLPPPPPAFVDSPISKEGDKVEVFKSLNTVSDFPILAPPQFTNRTSYGDCELKPKEENASTVLPEIHSPEARGGSEVEKVDSSTFNNYSHFNNDSQTGDHPKTDCPLEESDYDTGFKDSENTTSKEDDVELKCVPEPLPSNVSAKVCSPDLEESKTLPLSKKESPVSPNSQEGNLAAGVDKKRTYCLNPFSVPEAPLSSVAAPQTNPFKTKEKKRKTYVIDEQSNSSFISFEHEKEEDTGKEKTFSFNEEQLSLILLKHDSSHLRFSNGIVPRGRELPRTPPLNVSGAKFPETKMGSRNESRISDSVLSHPISRVNQTYSVSPANVGRELSLTLGDSFDKNERDYLTPIESHNRNVISSDLVFDDSLSLFPCKVRQQESGTKIEVENQKDDKVNDTETETTNGSAKDVCVINTDETKPEVEECKIRNLNVPKDNFSKIQNSHPQVDEIEYIATEIEIEGSEKESELKLEVKKSKSKKESGRSEENVNAEAKIKQDQRKTKSKRKIDNISEDTTNAEIVQKNETKTKVKKLSKNVEISAEADVEIKEDQEKAKSKRKIYNILEHTATVEDELKQNLEKLSNPEDNSNRAGEIKPAQRKTTSTKKIDTISEVAVHTEDEITQDQEKTKLKKRDDSTQDTATTESDTKQHQRQTKSKRKIDNISQDSENTAEIKEDPEKTKLTEDDANTKSEMKLKKTKAKKLKDISENNTKMEVIYCEAEMKQDQEKEKLKKLNETEDASNMEGEVKSNQRKTRSTKRSNSSGSTVEKEGEDKPTSRKTRSREKHTNTNDMKQTDSSETRNPKTEIKPDQRKPKSRKQSDHAVDITETEVKLTQRKAKSRKQNDSSENISNAETEMKPDQIKTKSKRKIDNVLEDPASTEPEINKDKEKTKLKKVTDSTMDTFNTKSEVKQVKGKAKLKERNDSTKETSNTDEVNQRKTKSRKKIGSIPEDNSETEIKEKTKLKKENDDTTDISNTEPEVKVDQRKTKSKKKIDREDSASNKAAQEKTKLKRLGDSTEDISKTETEIKEDQRRAKYNRKLYNIPKGITSAEIEIQKTKSKKGSESSEDATTAGAEVNQDKIRTKSKRTVDNILEDPAYTQVEMKLTEEKEIDSRKTDIKQDKNSTKSKKKIDIPTEVPVNTDAERKQDEVTVRLEKRNDSNENSTNTKGEAKQDQRKTKPRKINENLPEDTTVIEAKVKKPQKQTLSKKTSVKILEDTTNTEADVKQEKDKKSEKQCDNNEDFSHTGIEIKQDQRKTKSKKLKDISDDTTSAQVVKQDQRKTKTKQQSEYAEVETEHLTATNAPEITKEKTKAEIKKTGKSSSNDTKVDKAGLKETKSILKAISKGKTKTKAETKQSNSELNNGNDALKHEKATRKLPKLKSVINSLGGWVEGIKLKSMLKRAPSQPTLSTAFDNTENTEPETMTLDRKKKPKNLATKEATLPMTKGTKDGRKKKCIPEVDNSDNTLSMDGNTATSRGPLKEANSRPGRRCKTKAISAISDLLNDTD